MNPVLQFMVGPLLKYDTVDDKGVWHGACLIVSKSHEFVYVYHPSVSLPHHLAADAGSYYEPHPMLTYEWDPENPLQSIRKPQGNNPFVLAPHPADPHSTVSTLNVDPDSRPTPSHKTEHVPGHEIWVYEGING